MKLIFFLLVFFAGCSDLRPKQTKHGIIEDTAWYGEDLETSKEAQLRLDLDQYLQVLDVRAVGDAAWTLSRKPAYGEKKARKADFNRALNAFDPRQEIFVGDLAFINFETVVGEWCDRIRQEVSFYFLTDPAAITQGINHGFNLLSFSNNHAQDCELGRAFKERSDKKHGPLMTVEALGAILPDRIFLSNGVGEEGSKVQTKSFEIKNKQITVALGAISLLNWDIPNTKVFDYREPDVEKKIDEYLEEFNRNPADLKILSIHTQDASAKAKPEAEAFLLLKNIAQKFIVNFDGDLVMGHGPHTWGGVRVLKKAKGRLGVVFTSLGNFIHEGLGTNSDNYIGRAIYDIGSMRLRQVQVLPFTNNRKLDPLPDGVVPKVPLTYYDVKELKAEKDEEILRGVHANFLWRVGTFTDHENKKRGLLFATFPED